MFRWNIRSLGRRAEDINGRAKRTKPKNARLRAPNETLYTVKRKHAFTHNGQVGFTSSKVGAQKRKYGNSALGLHFAGAAGAHRPGLRLPRAFSVGTCPKWGSACLPRGR